MIETLSITFSLFWAAFLAATILPFSSEAALSGALLSDVPHWLLLLAAGTGNSLGSLTTFLLGHFGKISLLVNYCHLDPEKAEKWRQKLTAHGGCGAFLCFLPFIGDLFAIVLGLIRYPVRKFIILMTIGKFLRYFLWYLLHITIAGTI